MGQVTMRHTSPPRTFLPSKTSLASEVWSTAYQNIERMPSNTMKAVVVMSMVPMRNQPSRVGRSGSENW